MKSRNLGFAVALVLAGCGGAATTVVSTSHTAPPATDPTTTVAPTQDELGPPVGPVIDHSVNPSCGTELWAKKTLTDPGAAGVDITPGHITKVADLGGVDTDAGGPNRVGIELQVYSFTGKLLEAKQEADSDYHVVMQDDSGKTLVTEYPAPQCVQDAAPAARQEMDQARQDLEQACGPFDSSAFKRLDGTATVTGVGFYDRDHGQTGRDDLGNGYDAELHPIIGFKGACHNQGLQHRQPGDLPSIVGRGTD